MERKRTPRTGRATEKARSLFSMNSFLRSFFSRADSFTFPFSWRMVLLEDPRRLVFGDYWNIFKSLHYFKREFVSLWSIQMIVSDEYYSFISDIVLSIVQLSWHHWTVPNQCCFWSRNIFHQTWCALFSVTLCQSLEFCSALSYFTGTMLNYHNIAYMIDFSMVVKLNYNISMSSMTDMSYLCKWLADGGDGLSLFDVQVQSSGTLVVVNFLPRNSWSGANVACDSAQP